jgi:hypothetical protein
MDASTVFQFSNTFALSSWLLMIFLPKWKWTAKIVVGLVAVVLASLYVYYLFNSLSLDDFGKFGELSGLMSLFGSEEAVLLGWIHYLAFDMVVGLYILKHSQKTNISHLLIIPCLFLTFMTGPFGLLVYHIIHWVKTKSYFIEN